MDFLIRYDDITDQVEISAFLNDAPVGYITIEEVRSHPHVGYVTTAAHPHRNIKESRRRGIGTQLYLFSLSWLINNGWGDRLWASRCQSEAARQLWDSFDRRGWVVRDGTARYLRGSVCA